MDHHTVSRAKMHSSFSKMLQSSYRAITTHPHRGFLMPTRGVSSTTRTLAKDSARAEAGTSTQGSAAASKIVVFGGRGYVGSYVCQEALRSGLHVVGISRSGTPPASGAAWARDVEWIRGNALEPQTYRDRLGGVAAVISCVGGFGNQEEMFKINGTANVTVAETAKAEGVPRFVFISANIPNLPGISSLVGGYIKGKAAAEEAVRTNFPTTGVSLRPSVIYGDRVLSSSLTLPLGPVFGTMDKMLARGPKTLVDLPVIGGLFVRPVSAEAVAKAAIAAATDPSFPPGTLDLDEIRNYEV